MMTQSQELLCVTYPTLPSSLSALSMGKKKCQKNQSPEAESSSRPAPPSPSTVNTATLPVQLHCKGADLLSPVQRTGLAFSGVFIAHTCKSMYIFPKSFCWNCSMFTFPLWLLATRNSPSPSPDAVVPRIGWQCENWHSIWLWPHLPWTGFFCWAEVCDVVIKMGGSTRKKQTNKQKPSSLFQRMRNCRRLHKIGWPV